MMIFVKAIRTTLSVDEDVYGVARSIAASRDESIGAVLSELARKGLRRPPRSARLDRGVPVFQIPRDAPPLTPEMVDAALDED